MRVDGWAKYSIARFSESRSWRNSRPPRVLAIRRMRRGQLAEPVERRPVELLGDQRMVRPPVPQEIRPLLLGPELLERRPTKRFSADCLDTWPRRGPPKVSGESTANREAFERKVTARRMPTPECRAETIEARQSFAGLRTRTC